MTKVVVEPLKLKKGRTSKPDSIRIKRLRDEGGRLVDVWSLDARSDSFGADLLSLFAKNVRRARRDNKSVTGKTDRVPVKK